jgi:hypothetical protein
MRECDDPVVGALISIWVGCRSTRSGSGVDRRGATRTSAKPGAESNSVTRHHHRQRTRFGKARGARSVWVFPKIASYARAARISAAKVGLAGDHSTGPAIDRAKSPSRPVAQSPSRTGAQLYWWDWPTRRPVGFGKAGRLREGRSAPGKPVDQGLCGRFHRFKRC